MITEVSLSRNLRWFESLYMTYVLQLQGYNRSGFNWAVVLVKEYIFSQKKGNWIAVDVFNSTIIPWTWRRWRRTSGNRSRRRSSAVSSRPLDCCAEFQTLIPLWIKYKEEHSKMNELKADQEIIRRQNFWTFGFACVVLNKVKLLPGDSAAIHFECLSEHRLKSISQFVEPCTRIEGKLWLILIYSRTYT